MYDDEILEQEAEAFLNVVSKNVSKIRESQKKTKLEVSRELGFMFADHYSKMELRSKNKHFNIKHIFKLSKIFNVPISQFFEEKDE